MKKIEKVPKISSHANFGALLSSYLKEGVGQKKNVLNQPLNHIICSILI